MKNITLEETLETINKNLALLVKGDWLTVEQSAAVLTVAMDAYKQGKPLKNITLEETLETINKNLALLVKGDWLTVEQSAAVLTVAMDAYKQEKKGKGE